MLSKDPIAIIQVEAEIGTLIFQGESVYKFNTNGINFLFHSYISYQFPLVIVICFYFGIIVTDSLFIN